MQCGAACAEQRDYTHIRIPGASWDNAFPKLSFRSLTRRRDIGREVTKGTERVTIAMGPWPLALEPLPRLFSSGVGVRPQTRGPHNLAETLQPAQPAQPGSGEVEYARLGTGAIMYVVCGRPSTAATLRVLHYAIVPIDSCSIGDSHTP
jgi:hypothetical protein